MKLFGSLTSPYVRHCRIALMQSQCAFDLIPIDQQQSSELTPTKRVPFLRHGDMLLSDSASIIRFAREQANSDFLANVEDLDLFCFINTILDSAANVFYLEKFGLKPTDNAYIQRQTDRIAASLQTLESRELGYYQNQNDCHIRLTCLIDWMMFRHRINIDDFPELHLFTQQAAAEFAQTAPTE